MTEVRLAKLLNVLIAPCKARSSLFGRDFATLHKVVNIFIRPIYSRQPKSSTRILFPFPFSPFQADPFPRRVANVLSQLAPCFP